MIAGLLLAAGRSRRFGADKLCAKLDGKAVIRWSIGALSPLDAIYVVVPPGADGVMQALSRLDVRFVVNLGRDEGMASSIRAGVAALPEDARAVVIALADQPHASAAVTRAVVDRWKAGGVSAVAPSYQDGRGHPVLFGRDCFAELLALRGDAGARSVMDGLGGDAALVEVPEGMPIDVDTPEALASLQLPRRGS